MLLQSSGHIVAVQWQLRLAYWLKECASRSNATHVGCSHFVTDSSKHEAACSGHLLHRQNFERNRTPPHGSYGEPSTSSYVEGSDVALMSAMAATAELRSIPSTAGPCWSICMSLINHVGMIQASFIYIGF